MYDIKYDIDIPNHSYFTHQKTKYNVILPKMRTVFGQHCPKYVLINIT